MEIFRARGMFDLRWQLSFFNLLFICVSDIEIIPITWAIHVGWKHTISHNSLVLYFLRLHYLASLIVPFKYCHFLKCQNTLQSLQQYAGFFFAFIAILGQILSEAQHKTQLDMATKHGVYLTNKGFFFVTASEINVQFTNTVAHDTNCTWDMSANVLFVKYQLCFKSRCKVTPSVSHLLSFFIITFHFI